ncbi:hypothetical protein V8E53_013873 [Lactarius tabidus]
MNAQSLCLPNDPSSGNTSYDPYDGLNITRQKLEKLEVQGETHTSATSIGILSDNVLLDIFDCCRKMDDQPDQPDPFRVWKWPLLVHVCRRWRQIIFASPRRLDLHLLCTSGNPFRKTMHIWPTIPIIILFLRVISWPSDEDNLIAALEHPDRVSRIEFFMPRSKFGKMVALMQHPFPVLTHLSLFSQHENTLTLPDGFLGGSAPSLQQLDLCDIPFPGLPTLLLSTGNLVSLSLRNISPTGYVSPEAMVSLVATSPKLEILYLEFEARSSIPDLIISPPIMRTVLPALRKFLFSGASKYLEVFVSHIDTPQLNCIAICYSWSQEINIDVPQLSEFINHSERLKQSLSRHCNVAVNEDQEAVSFHVGRTTSDKAEIWDSIPGISVCLTDEIKRQISQLTSILGYIFPILSDVVHCTIDDVLVFIPGSASGFDPEYRDSLDWLQLLRHLSSLQTLFVSDSIAGPISRALACVNGEMITEVMPALKLLCLDGSEEEDEDQPMPSVHRFIAVRQESGHPLTFVKTKEEFEVRLKTYL